MVKCIKYYHVGPKTMIMPTINAELISERKKRSRGIFAEPKSYVYRSADDKHEYVKYIFDRSSSLSAWSSAAASIYTCSISYP